jgi:hypothetical protein
MSATMVIHDATWVASRRPLRVSLALSVPNHWDGYPCPVLV